MRCYPFAGCQLELVLEDFSGTSYSVGVSAEGNTKGFSGGGGVGFLGASTLLTSWYTLDGDVHRVCAIATPATPADPPCGVTIEQVGAPLSWPDGSRDGTLIAAARGPLQEGGSTVVNVYDATTGAALREVAAGTAPAFSPDGRFIAFETPEKQIAVVPAAGGTPRTLVAGTAPTWSAGAGPGARLAATTARLRKGRIRLSLRCEGSARCTGAVRVTKGRTTIGSGGYRVAAGASARVAVKTTSAAARRSRSAASTPSGCGIAPRGGAAYDDEARAAPLTPPADSMIATERLTLRPFREEDLPAFVAYRSAPEVARYQSWDTTYSMADAERFLASQRAVEFAQPGEWVQLAAVDRASGELCGDCAVRVVSDQPGHRGARRHPGPRASRPRAGERGAQRRHRPAVRRARHAPALRRVPTTATAGCTRLLERLGFRQEARLVEADWFKGEWTTLRVYAILRREWAA